MAKIKELAQRRDLLAPGHRACAGCAAPSVFRQVLMVAGPDTVCTCATGCMEVVTTIYPFTSWRVPFIHSAFENSAATISGIEAAYRSLKKQGKLPVDRELKFIAFGGDGGTYDIGFQALSGAMERGHNILYVCYDNQAYMNTGIQRSSATPLGAATMTSPAGKVIPGKRQQRKDLTACIVAHNVPYVAQASPHNYNDLLKKVEKALSTEGASFLNVLAPCHRGWRYKMEDTFKLAKMAVDTCLWPLFEVENGQWKLNYKPKEKVPIAEWIAPQRRFDHLKKPEFASVVDDLQAEVDRKWEELCQRCGE